MSSTPRAARSALLVLVGVVGITSVAAAQRNPIRIGRAASSPPQPSATTPYPGATVTIDPRFYGAPQGQFPGRRRQHDRMGNFNQSVPIYYPYATYGSAGGVYDTNGRPLYNGVDYQAPTPVPYPAPVQYPSPTQYNDFPVATPDLTGSPYVVIEGGTMIVDFGNGDRRAVPSCAVVEAASTPDGQPRTLFYRPPAYQLVLRSGQRGQVIGKPTAGARICYANDAYGRVALAY
jgi:hypothetical protein